MKSDFLKKMITKLNGKDVFDLTAKEQEEYLSKFPEPKSDEQRSFYQYKAQMKLKSVWARFVLNMASIPMLIAYSLKFKKKPICTDKKDAVFVMEGNVSPNVLPDSLKEEFKSLEYYKEDNRRLSAADRRFLCKLYFKRILSPHYVAKIMYKISKYRWLIDKYEPKALIVHNEYSFNSSLATVFCNKNGVELINAMHGEKLFYMRDSFFKFNRCYIWNEFYKELFISLRADPDQFIVELPPSLKFEKTDVEKTVDYTYYLQAQKGEELKFIIEKLGEISEKGNKVAVRPHPRYTDFGELNTYIGETSIEVESCKDITIEKSILRTRNVISLFSTVLFQAYSNGVNAIVDDMSNIEKYNKLKEYKFIMTSVDCLLLSQSVERVSIEV